jgi:hypothetical protein
MEFVEEMAVICWVLRVRQYIRINVDVRNIIEHPHSRDVACRVFRIIYFINPILFQLYIMFSM